MALAYNHGHQVRFIEATGSMERDLAMALNTLLMGDDMRVTGKMVTGMDLARCLQQMGPSSTAETGRTIWNIQIKKIMFRIKDAQL